MEPRQASGRQGGSEGKRSIEPVILRAPGWRFALALGIILITGKGVGAGGGVGDRRGWVGGGLCLVHNSLGGS